MAQTKADQGKDLYALFISVVQSKWGFFLKQILTKVSRLDLDNLASDSSPSSNYLTTFDFMNMLPVVCACSRS